MNEFSIEKSIRDAVVNRVNEIVEEETEQAKKRIAERIVKESTQIAITVYSKLSYEMMGKEIMIHIKP